MIEVPKKTGLKAALIMAQYGDKTVHCRESVIGGVQYANGHTKHTLYMSMPFIGHQLKARNSGVIQSLKGFPDADVFIFVDSDSVFNFDAFSILLDDVQEGGYDIIGALFVKGADKHGTTFMRKHPRKPGHFCPFMGPLGNKDVGIIGGDGDNVIGLGLTAVKREVLEKIPKPCFAMPPQENSNSCIRPDVYFCLQAQDLGFKIWCDLRIPTGHEKLYIYTLDDFLRYREPVYGHLKLDENNEPLYIDINLPSEDDIIKSSLILSENRLVAPDGSVIN